MSTPNPTPTPALLRRPEVTQLTGMCRSHIYRLIQQGEFPPPVHLGARMVAWRAEEVAEWIRSRPQGTRPTNAHPQK